MENVKRLQFGESLDYYSLSYNNTKETLRRVLEDPKYTINVKRLSALVRDQKENPLDRAVWWIEWLLRHPNIDNLESPVQKLGYIAGNSLDVIAFATIITLFLCVAVLIIFSLLFKKIILQLSNKVIVRMKKHEKQH